MTECWMSLKEKLKSGNIIGQKNHNKNESLKQSLINRMEKSCKQSSNHFLTDRHSVGRNIVAEK